MSKARITTGDDATLVQTLKKTNTLTGVLETFTIDPAAVVTSRIIDNDHNIISETFTADESHTDADWANSKVIVEVPKSASEPIAGLSNLLWKNGRVQLKLETQVLENGLAETWFDTITVYRGTIL